MQTIQQQRAKFALERVVSASHDRSVNGKEFKSYAAGLPAMIHMSGLGQAAAFYKAKGGTYGKLYQLLSDWLTQENQPYAGRRELLEGITQDDMHRYRLAQAEAQALMEWVKKFASAYMAEA
ncbi:type III-B CRISPR module-associated protein Cmr5 [Thiothrix subterranea]|uniref:CRISPR type III-B/RAMP module-associated protein Cmr5 n=1 Tax=Thiothrix subterranea TaxID=2735563 RepID=A0ABU0Y550_9GAMM|nr:type III-B CRISPR module-associated protein Cmr5 [Thiothrix subterranea]MDQ5767905.1 type III-B CRISPR module-associated protein Cmr5 [Thiothrix subterranea]